MDGAVLVPGDADYDEARSVWNAAIDRRPAAIARCSNAADVSAAVSFGVDNGLEIAVSWLPEGVTVEQVATGLRPLLEKPVEFVLPTHGEPADRAALERALA